MNEIEKLFDYLNFKNKEIKSDILIGCGCIDAFIPLECVKLFNDYNYKKILFTGYKGKGTIGKIKKSEAEIFRDIVIRNGINKDNILIEDKSMSTYSNIKNCFKILKNVDYKNIMVVHKPYVNRRLNLIIKKYNNICVHNYDVSFNEFVKKSSMSEKQIIEEMVGEIYLLKNIHRVKIEKNILKIYYNLINDGYKKYVYLFDNLIYKFYV